MVRVLATILACLASSLALASEARPDDRPVVYGEFWPSLEEMTPAERANSEIWLEPGPGSTPGAYTEARAISGLWNRGEYEAAIERSRGFSRFGNPAEVAVAVNPRKLVASDPGFGLDIRIGTRDSLYGCSFDRLNNGWLFASFPCRDSNRTYIYSYRSTDDGATWTELASFSWNYARYVRTTAAVCHGDYLVVAVAIGGLSSHRCFTARLSTTTGEVVLYPDSTMFIPVLESTPGDSIMELAAASSEDQYPGSTIYLFGRTRAGALKYAWTDSSARAWRLPNTNVDAGCNNGLDCTYNEGYGSRYVWASWMKYISLDTARLYCGHWQAGNQEFQVRAFTAGYGAAGGYPSTAIAAYRDTVLIGYLGANYRHLDLAYNVDCNSGFWQSAPLTDTLDHQYSVEVSGRRGGGFAAAYHNYSTTTQESRVLFQHADSASGPYTEPDTVNEQRTAPYIRIRTEKLSAGEYGVAWVSSPTGYPYGAAYFDRVSIIGVAEPEPPRPVPLGLQVLPKSRGVRLAFDNPASGLVHLRLFDLTGRVEFSREENLAAGRQAIDVTPRASGVYFAVVEAAGKRASVRFAFAR
jgi:hypothetical protein